MIILNTTLFFHTVKLCSIDIICMFMYNLSMYIYVLKYIFYSYCMELTYVDPILLFCRVNLFIQIH